MKMHLRQAPETDAVTRLLRTRRTAVATMAIQPRMLRSRSGDSVERRHVKLAGNAARGRDATTQCPDHAESQFDTDTSTFHLNAA